MTLRRMLGTVLVLYSANLFAQFQAVEIKKPLPLPVHVEKDQNKDSEIRVINGDTGSPSDHPVQVRVVSGQAGQKNAPVEVTADPAHPIPITGAINLQQPVIVSADPAHPVPISGDVVVKQPVQVEGTVTVQGTVSVANQPQLNLPSMFAAPASGLRLASGSREFQLLKTSGKWICVRSSYGEVLGNPELDGWVNTDAPTLGANGWLAVWTNGTGAHTCQ